MAQRSGSAEDARQLARNVRLIHVRVHDGKAIQRGYIGADYQRVACKGYRGVLSQLTGTPDGDVHIANICEGTNVSDLSYYLNRARKTDDEHGLGAFIIMNEVMRKTTCASPDAAAKEIRK